MLFQHNPCFPQGRMMQATVDAEKSEGVAVMLRRQVRELLQQAQETALAEGALQVRPTSCTPSSICTNGNVDRASSTTFVLSMVCFRPIFAASTGLWPPPTSCKRLGALACCGFRLCCHMRAATLCLR